MFNALTIDVEDYFQVHAFSSIIKYEDWERFDPRLEYNVQRILEILNDLPPTSILSPRMSQHATFFLLGWIAERYPDLIRKIQKEGHEIACHGFSHKLIYNQSKEEFREDIRKAKCILEDITGNEVIGYRAPSYSITRKSRWAFEILLEEGFKYDSSIFPIHHDFYGMAEAPRFPFIISLNGNSNFEFSILNFERSHQHNSVFSIKWNDPPNSDRLIEFPISTVRILGQNFPISGGGYFRLFPYSLIKMGLRRINEREKRPFIFYIHPWEIDPEQPRIHGISFKSSFRHYINLDKTENKFRRLLRDFHFTTIRNLLNLFCLRC